MQNNLIKRRRGLVAALAFLFVSVLFAADSVVTVCVTAKGKKYHFASCRTLKNSASVIELPLEDAKKRGYEPCGVCKSAWLDMRTKAAGKID